MMAGAEFNNETITVTSSIFPYDDPPVRKCASTIGADDQAATSGKEENKYQALWKSNTANISHLRAKTTREKTVIFENAGKNLTTRERVLLLEDELEKRRKKTSTRTRERLMELEIKLEEKKQGTSSYTRERLAEVEKMLAQSKLKTSSRTREKLALAEEDLKMLKAATSTKTREKLREVEEAIKIENDKRASTMTLEAFRKKQDVLRKMMKDNSNLDIAFLVDCTGSMGSYIAETKKDIEHIVTSIKETFENKVQVAFVGYRDHSDGHKRIECLQFTEDIAAFRAFVGGITADGGDDMPEDVLGGIEAAVNLGWSSKNKVLFHVGDAPQHGPRFHNLDRSADHYYDHEPRGLQIEELLSTIKQLKINYFFAKINESTDKMIQEFKNTGGHEIVQYADLKTPDLMSLLVVDSVTKTIDASIGRSLQTFKMSRLKYGLSVISEVSDGGKTLKEFSISEVGPDEVKMNETKSAHWLECFIPFLSNVSQIKNKIGAINHKWTTTTIKIAADPFAQGEQRITYHGERIYPSKFMKGKESIVLKEFKHIGRGRDRRGDYIEIMETQAIAAYLANQFNKIAPPGSKEIQFLHVRSMVSVVQIFKTDGSPKYFNVEVLLSDYKERFTKWNNNCGYVSEANYSATLDAFSHWTYTVTEGFLMVVDLQGVDRDDKYILTDPSIHCKEPRFGLTNLGNYGMEEFFKSHRCGSVCEAMKLEKNRYMKSTTPRRLSKLLTKILWI